MQQTNHNDAIGPIRIDGLGSPLGENRKLTVSGSEDELHVGLGVEVVDLSAQGAMQLIYAVADAMRSRLEVVEALGRSVVLRIDVPEGAL